MRQNTLEFIVSTSSLHSTIPAFETDGGRHVRALTRLFAEVERAFPVHDRTRRFGRLVTPNGNALAPIHRWYVAKEGFSMDLLGVVLGHLGLNHKKPISLLDPFCGSGTTLVSAQSLSMQGWPIYAAGVEVNPFFHLVSTAKTKARLASPQIILQLASLIATVAEELEDPEIPELSTLRNPRTFPSAALHQMLRIKGAIDHVASNMLEHHALLAGFAKAIDSVSNVRKDGRALRVVVRQSQAEPIDVVTGNWKEIADDTEELSSRVVAQADAYLGDGRNMGAIFPERNRFDLVVTSPPYPNNIDYTEVYKLELWLSGLIASHEQFRSQRLRTFRSHPSVRFEDPDPIAMTPQSTTFRLVEGIVGQIPADDDQAWRTRLFWSYAEDAKQAMQEQHRLLRPGGFSALCIGNSVHGKQGRSIVMPADLIFASAAIDSGFEVCELAIARQLRRRRVKSKYLRESILVVRKPR